MTPSAQALSEASRFASRSTLGLPYAKLVELGVFDRVTTFTTSDFGRTLTSNGKGSNRGWGDHHIIIGGAIYAPTTPIDVYCAELALWFCIPVSDLAEVRPNIKRFYTPGSTSPPMGFPL